MASFFAQKYRDLYKVHNGAADAATSTGRRHLVERRAQFLAAQKKQRQEQVNEARGLVHAIESYSLPNYASNRLPYRVDVFYRNKVQLSEWLRDRPDDLDQWILVPCPRGKRHIVVAAANKTIAYSKSGCVIDIFQSSLQSGRYLTVLDCIFSEETQSFYVLDVLVYHNQEFLLCDAAFRFYWIRSKFDEFDHSQVHAHNQYAFYHIDRADFDHPEEVEGMLSRYPLWEENKPALDGFLVYHKLSHYHHGKTPLVGWLCPWMVPEVLGYSVNAQYVKERPTGQHVKALEFMNEFDESRKQGQQQKRRHFFNGKKKEKSGGGGGDNMEVQQQQEESAECSWTANSQKMEVQHLTVELDDVDLREDDLDEDQELDIVAVEREDQNRGDGEFDETSMELLEKRRGNAKNRNNINQEDKRISTVFKF